MVSGGIGTKGYSWEAAVATMRMMRWHSWTIKADDITCLIVEFLQQNNNNKGYIPDANQSYK